MDVADSGAAWSEFVGTDLLKLSHCPRDTHGTRFTGGGVQVPSRIEGGVFLGE